ncbi:hypothetical protein FACS1894204_08820 [Synergistales bacterium]|nr:hypothetical protein FACS1894204_08820 [Synergistales bacterium]
MPDNMIDVEIPFGDERLSFSIPRKNLAEIIDPKPWPALHDVAGSAGEALAEPIGLPSTKEWLKPGSSVVILCDDNTRPTPADKLLPPLLDHLNAAGVPDSSILIIIALGTHRYMSAREIETKVGRGVTARVKVINHEWRDENNLMNLGETSQGTPLIVNRRIMECDALIALGSIVPHHIPGFSGSSKIIQPGVCGPLTTAAIHFLSCRGGNMFLGVADNPVRRDMDEMADKVKLKAVLNVVLTVSGETAGVFWGDFRKVFKRGVDMCEKIYGVPYHENADIVIAGSHPCDIDFWQAHKSIYPAQKIVKKGGVIIIATPCPEGISPVHTDLADYAGCSSKALIEGFKSGELKDGVGASLATAWAIAREKADIITFSPGITKEDKEKLGHTHAPSIVWAIEEAFRRQGENARVTVLPHSPDTLPLSQ